MRVIGVDPGGTTGICWGDTDDMPLFEPTLAQLPDRMGVGNFVEKYMQVGVILRPTHGVLVIERFDLRSNVKSQQLDPLYIIGMCEWLCWRHGWEFVLQTPAQAKSFATNDKLKAAGWYVPGQEHARDASRHLLTWLCTTKEGRANGGEAILRKIIAASV